MTYFINLVIYGVIYLYLFTAAINFFHPIVKIISIIIIFISMLLSFLSAVFVPFSTFSLTNRIKRIPKIWFITIFFFLPIWFFVVLHRPTIDTDANVYHLPLSILMNHSVWYPGIGKLCHHFGFPNGNSVLASAFTSFGISGFENIPNLIIWLIFGVGIFIYSVKKKINLFISFAVSLLFLFTPVLFWQSYNMGTDLPCACFLLFGLLALSDKHFEDASLFLSLSAIFKTLGIVAFGLFIPYMLVIYRREKINLLHPKFLLSFILFTVFLIRIFIATGNPIYPVLPLKLVSWGISPGIQKGIVNGSLRYYSGIERNLVGFFIFIKDFLFFPHRVRSSYWFSPFLLVCLVPFLYLFIRDKFYRRINANTSFISFLVIIIFIIWFIGSPLFRFIAGVLIFITLKLFIFLSNDLRVSKLYNGIIYVSLFATLSLFTFNAGKHIKNDVFPLINAPERTVETFMPFDKKIFSSVKTKDGFMYFKSSSTYCGRMKPPCINSYSIGSEEKLIKEYRRYNRL